MEYICHDLFIMAAMIWSTSAAPSYTTVCIQETGCEVGFYCETDFTCKPCLRCDDLKREPPPTPMTCVISILQCGQCIDGFKEDRITAECITPTEQGFPTWTIVIIVAGSLLLFTLICSIAVYILRNLLCLKIFASTTIRTPCDNHIEQVCVSPPPYNFAPLLPKAQPVEGKTQPSDNCIALLPKTQPFDESLPFTQDIQDVNESSSRKREPLERQTARVFRYPDYLRNPQVESIYETPINVPALESAEHQEESLFIDIRTNNQELVRVPEATVQHTIVPQTSPVRQDSNNSSQTEENEDSTNSSFNANGKQIVFNIIHNVTAVQRNDVRI